MTGLAKDYMDVMEMDMDTHQMAMIQMTKDAIILGFGL